MKSDLEHTSTMLGSQNMKSSQRMVSVVEPYELPEGWKWCRLGDVAEIIMGQSPAGTSMTENQNDIAFIGGASDMGEELPNISRYTSEPTKLSKRDDVIVCIRATLGRPIFSDGIYCLGRGVAGIRSETLMKEYIKYGFLNFEQYLYDKATGSTFLQVSSKYLNEMPFPLPPTLADQQRIVNRIESMFAKLDEAKEKAQNVVDGFETRKAAILHKAFTGELTAKWRKENGVSDDSWVAKRFDEVAEIKSNLVDIAEYQDFPHIAPDNIEKKTGVLLEYHTVAEDKVTSGKHRFYAGQILYSKIRPYLSKVVIVDFDGVCSADMYPIEAKGNTKFLWYQMLSNEFLDKASNSGSRSVLPKINQKELSVIPMQICSLPEQVEIVRILDIIIEKENKAKQAAEAVLEQIGLLKKSILARAFRGKI